MAYKIYCDGLRTRLNTLLPHANSVSFHVLTDQGTLHKFPEFGANGLGAFTTWVPGAGMGHEGGLRLASGVFQANVCCNASRSVHSQRCQQT